MREHAGLYPIRLMCRCLEVSASGYYRWIGREESPQAIRRKWITERVKGTFETLKARYGAPRIARELLEAGIACSTNYIAGIMHKEHIRARNGKGFPCSRPVEGRVNVAANLLKRCFQVDSPNCRWTSDITYIWVKDRWLYLAVVMDLYSRRIVGWALDTQMTEELTQRALKMALQQRNSKPGLIVHSDRGIQYRAQG
ncbi:IS3 family transposase [Microbulbifer sp. YPW16]|uniref:IS3 family transposase n=1 Tax=unclassified Microbulbifer TaxID=2619833 RepID=UPI001E51D136|nr:IS3 family transposase [Microbulbifer sp. YPW16]UHQ57130.1 IS3 family transposase [Microbulbifer sp. YPW16]